MSHESGQAFPGTFAARSLAPRMSASFCPFCGKPAVAEASFCAACGKALPQAGAASPGARAASPGAGAAGGAAAPETEVYSLRPLAVRTLLELLICLLTLGLAFVFLWISRLGKRYLVTTQRIETRTGLATIHREHLDIFRIEDFEIDEPFFLRLRGAGNLRIYAGDKDEPLLVMEAIPGLAEVYETLRGLTREERRRNQVRVVEGM